MIIKKFQGKTEAEAVENAKKELGNGIVIMNVRNVKKKGIFSFLRQQLVEVTVALEEEPVRPAGIPETNRNLTDAIANIRSVSERSLQQEAAEKKEQSAQEDKRADSAAIEEKLDSLHFLLEQQMQKPEENKSEEKTEDTEEEPPSEMEQFMKLLYNTMLENEVNEKYANQIIDEIEKSNKPNMPFDYALSNIYQKMILKFGKPAGVTPAAQGPKMIFFIGPTGVGKTTTIAKIASRFCVDGGRKVALLTADTYRIAAAEQLRTYANILEVPFRIIYSVEEISQAMRDFKDYDYILVDTAGHSHQNTEQKEVMKELIHSVDGIIEKEVFLVLSATTKYRDLLSIADTYSDVTDYKLIFTKLDETTTLGNLLNLKLYTGAPLSYVTCGQNVPDDIEDFNPQKTVKRLLGGKQK
ncbi:MAG: flagellar biosynthesis protein FlhF [Lachnospiraceae bacterium]|nr:flagellar biosynthesis protein FlhF [Lachnospiraceae bacterium]